MRMVMSLATIFLSLTAAAAEVPTAPASYLLDVTRDGKAMTEVVYDWWSGEWPGPIVNVNAEAPGETTIQAFSGLQVLDTPVSCTIKNGLYHPWGDSPSLVSFHSIVPESNYTAKVAVDFPFDDRSGVTQTAHLAPGDVLRRLTYDSEGYCTVMIPVNGALVQGQISCDQILPQVQFDAYVGEGVEEQWFSMACAEGTTAFVQDSALLAQPGIKEGQFGEYGTVKP